MSTVVGIIEDKKIWIGCDSQATSQQGEIRPIICDKVFRNGDFLIGYVGSVRSGQILRPELFPLDSTSIASVLHLPDYIRLHFETYGCLSRDDDQSQMTTSNFLIASKDGLFEILADYQINEVPKYTAIGSGSNFAFGSLFTTHEMNKFTPVERIEYALNAAARFDASSSGPFKIYPYDM
jgi:ATP-dependent protease HslVU (ClpYQ) peptidase subunit